MGLAPASQHSKHLRSANTAMFQAVRARRRQRATRARQRVKARSWLADRKACAVAGIRDLSLPLRCSVVLAASCHRRDGWMPSL